MAGEREQRISTKVDEQLKMHSARIESLNQSVETTQQKAADHTGILQDLLVGLENMDENMKRFREEMKEWRNPELQMAAEREHAHLNEELLQEVSLSVPVTSAPSQNENAPMSQNQTPSSVPQMQMNEPVIVSEAPRQDAAVIDQELQEMRDRVSALKKPYPGASIFSSSNMQEGFQFGKRQVREMN